MSNEASLPKQFEKSHKVLKWRNRNLFESMDTYQINQQNHFPWKEEQDSPHSVIVIPDDSCFQRNDQTNNVIILSDSDSDSLSLPDIEEPFDLYPNLDQFGSQSSFIKQDGEDNKVKFSLPNFDSRYLTQDLRTTKDAADDVIYISEDSCDLDSIKNTNSEKVICVTSDDFVITLNDSLENESLDRISPAFSQSEEKGFFSDFVQDLIKETEHVGRNETNNEVHIISNSILNTKNVDVDHSIALKSLCDYILPYSVQPYTKNTNLGIEDLKDQPQLTVELIRSHLDEGRQFPLATADIFCHYLYSYRPAQCCLEDLLNWLQHGDIEFMPGSDDVLQLPYFKIYGLLNELFYRYPENAFLLWDAISETKLTAPIGNRRNIFLNFAFILEIYLTVLEGDLFRVKDSKTCQVHCHLLKNNKSYANIKKIIEWLNQVVMIFIDQSFSRAEHVMCQLEKLLELCVVVSVKNFTLAKRIAKDLVDIYLTIPHLKLRQRFLSTIQSELIKFKFLEILLEKYCDGTSLHWNTIPESIGDVAKAFFCATSLKTKLLDVSIKGNNNHMASAQCEELIMLIYFVIATYLHCVQDSYHEDLLSRSESVHGKNGDVLPPWGNHFRQLKDFPLYISKLKRHIQSLNIELSKESLFYLQMIDCLTDLMGQDIPISVF